MLNVSAMRSSVGSVLKSSGNQTANYRINGLSRISMHRCKADRGKERDHQMKKTCALFLVLCLLIAPAAPVYAETPISGVYVYEEDGMPKYWLDFTGSVADNVVLHCFFQTDSWYETYYVLDFNSSVPESHQDTCRIETVWDAKGNDVSNWFKTISLTIQEDRVRLYIERDDKTLAGGPSSTILTGLYEMTPAKAGVVYEAYSDNKLRTWVLLNRDYAELHFADGTEWHLQAENSDDHTKKAVKIISSDNTDIAFEYAEISYEQGLILLALNGVGEYSGDYTLRPRAFLQKDAESEAELKRMAQMYCKRISGFYPPEADAEDNGDGTYTVHLYEIVPNGDGTYHTATSAWYTVNASGVGVDDLFGSAVNLNA